MESFSFVIFFSARAYALAEGVGKGVPPFAISRFLNYAIWNAPEF